MRKFIRIRAIFLVMFAIGLYQNGYGQFAFNNIPFKLKKAPHSSYKIIQFRDDEITKIEEVDNRGEMVFQYIQGDIPPFFNWKEPHRFIYANELNAEGDIVKRYAFNSNAGHYIYSYEYDQGQNTKTTYEQSYFKDDAKRNSNTYANISRIKTLKQLKESSEVSNMMASPKVILNTEFLNKVSKPVRIDEYSNAYKDSTKTLIKYNDSNQEISRKVITSSNQEVKREVLNEYPDNNSKITTIVNYRDGLKISSYQFAQVEDDLKGSKTEYSERNGVLNVRHYLYEGEYLTSIIVYHTKFKKKLIVPISRKLKKVAEIKYSYNEQGLLEKEEMNNYKTGQEEARTYKYQIEEL